ncbi:MAG TPA: hypothetical protein PKG49_12055, partial [Nitrosomonas mobilis]|nr:hypothetical protein [Nitrosomonas mobilis]
RSPCTLFEWLTFVANQEKRYLKHHSPALLYACQNAVLIEKLFIRRNLNSRTGIAQLNKLNVNGGRPLGLLGNISQARLSWLYLTAWHMVGNVN